MAEPPTAPEPREFLDQRARGMLSGVREVFTFVRSVRQGAALRSTATVFETFVETWALPTAAPHWTSGRMWLLRVGLFKLTRPKPVSDDWIWFADHSGSPITRCRSVSRSAWSCWAFGSATGLLRERA